MAYKNLKESYESIYNTNPNSINFYNPVKWSFDKKRYMFLDGKRAGSQFRTEIRPGKRILIDDILVEPRLHRIEMQITQGEEIYNYSTRMHEAVLDLFGSYGEQEVLCDERRPNLSLEEIQAIETIPDKILREMILCTITRPISKRPLKNEKG